MVGQLAGRSVSQVAEESVGPLLVLFAAEGGGGGTQGEVGKEMKRSAQISSGGTRLGRTKTHARACTIKLDGHSSHPDESKHIFKETASDHKSCYVNICINLTEVLSAAHPHAAFPPRFKPVRTWGRTTEATAAK